LLSCAEPTFGQSVKAIQRLKEESLDCGRGDCWDCSSFVFDGGGFVLGLVGHFDGQLIPLWD